MPAEALAPLMKYHVHEHMVTLTGNRLLSLIRLKGVSHETRDKADLDQLFHRLNRYFFTLGKKEGKSLMLQTYVTKSQLELDGEYRSICRCCRSSSTPTCVRSNRAATGR